MGVYETNVIMMKFMFLCYGVCWLSIASGGVIKDQEKNLTYNAVAEEAVLKELASKDLLTDDEKKIVDLLKRIQEKFGTLEEGEKVEFKKKIASYQDRFITTLEKVEKVPGMFGLDVQLLRTNLGIPETGETLEEIHDPRDAREFEEGIPDATVEIAPNMEETWGTEDVALERAAAGPSISSSQVEIEPKRTLNDVYDVMTQLVQLVLVQIIQEENKPDPVMHNYYYPSMPAQSPTSYRRVKSPRKPKKPTPARAIPPGHMRQQQVPFNHDADKEAIEEALIVALEYAEWYDNVYMPWYESQEHMMEDLLNLPQMKVDHNEGLAHLENYSMVMQQLQEYMKSIN